jgi:hypothetical protein
LDSREPDPEIEERAAMWLLSWPSDK